MRRIFGLLAISALLLGGGVLEAQNEFPQVTVLLRSGERVSGGFQDLANDQFYIRTGMHSDRRLPREQVALLDFVGGTRGLPETELREARGDAHVLLLRDGKSMKGQLLRTEGAGKDGPGITFVFRTDSGEERRFHISQVGRLYLGRFQNQATATSGTRAASTDPNTTTIRVPANQRWTDTGLTVRKGEVVRFSARGEIHLSGDASDAATPAGSKAGRYPSGGPMPRVLAGGLLGRIGPTNVFGIGDQTQVSMPADGRLFLGVNDDQIADNRGEFTVEITRDPYQQPRR